MCLQVMSEVVVRSLLEFFVSCEGVTNAGVEEEKRTRDKGDGPMRIKR
jgi:hypothetical protein